MAKLLLLSVVIMMFTIPLVIGRDRNGRRSLKKVLLLALFWTGRKLNGAF